MGKENIAALELSVYIFQLVGQAADCLLPQMTQQLSIKGSYSFSKRAWATPTFKLIVNVYGGFESSPSQDHWIIIVKSIPITKYSGFEDSGFGNKAMEFWFI